MNALAQAGRRMAGASCLQPEAARVSTWGFGFGGAVLIDPVLARTPLPVGSWRWRGAYGHHWLVDPRNELVVVSLSNTAVEGMSDRHVAELTDAIYGVVPQP